MNKLTFLTIHPEIQEGAPVFSGTHIRYETFHDYMRIGVSLNEFLNEFPSITREQALQALETTKYNLTLDQVAQMASQIDLRARAR